MKFAVCNETFQDWPMDRALAFAAECGYTGVEIAPFTLAQRATDVTASRRAEIRQQAAAAGLDVVGLHWLLAKTEGFHVTSPDAEVRRATAAYLGELARRIGFARVAAVVIAVGLALAPAAVFLRIVGE